MTPHAGLFAVVAVAMFGIIVGCLAYSTFPPKLLTERARWLIGWSMMLCGVLVALGLVGLLYLVAVGLGCAVSI